MHETIRNNEKQPSQKEKKHREVGRRISNSNSRECRKAGRAGKSEEEEEEAEEEWDEIKVEL